MDISFAIAKSIANSDALSTWGRRVSINIGVSTCFLFLRMPYWLFTAVSIAGINDGFRDTDSSNNFPMSGPGCWCAWWRSAFWACTALSLTCGGWTSVRDCNNFSSLWDQCTASIRIVYGFTGSGESLTWLSSKFTAAFELFSFSLSKSLLKRDCGGECD